MPIFRRIAAASSIVCRQRVLRRSCWPAPTCRVTLLGPDNRVMATAATAAAAASSSLAPKMGDQIASTHSVVKSESDKNEYRGLVLKNGLKVLLVSDSTTDKSACALNVQVGTLCDPRTIPGLAHFCEHMLFLGTKKYPRENHYHDFLSEHGGMSNAYTAHDHTCYFFDVTPDHFKEATDVFAQFFLEPLFDQDCTDRELNAVDSEHEKNINQDMWRMWQLECTTGNPDHDFSKFGTGNRETLGTVPSRNGVDVRKVLLDFHEKWYSSNIMSVCLLGKESLDDLADIAIELFAGVRNKSVAAPHWPDHPFTDKELRLQAKIVPVKDLRQMVITFPVPDMREHYRTNPAHYVSHLVGHEGEGSLLSYLKRQGWANSLSGGLRPGARGFSFFTISMNLSPEGLEHADEIATALFQYLTLLRQQGPQSWVFEELKNLGIMHFRFKSKEVPINYVASLTDSMHNYEWNDILSAPYLVEEYKPELITELMTYLVPEKVRIALVSKKFAGQTDKVEKYYSTEYSLEPIPEEKISAWKNIEPHPELHLPTPNEFIPTNFALAAENAKYTKTPDLLIDEPHTRVWFMQDKEYNLPINMAALELRSPLVYQDALSSGLAHMAVMCFNDANNEYFYPAVLAGSSYHLETNMYGLLLKIRGYNERQQAILERVLERLVDFKIDPQRFEVLKESYIRSLKNFTAEQPYQHAVFYMNALLSERYWTHEQVLAVVEKECTIERCEAFLQQVLRKIYVESLVHGNMTADEARKMGETVRSVLKSEPLTFDETRNFQEHRLRDGEVYQLDRYNEVHPTNAVMSYYQVGKLRKADIRTTAVNDLFCQIMEEPCFQILRTKQQLGYIVSGGIRRMHDAYGMRVIVQSEKNPSLVSGRIDAFVNESMKKHLEEMQPEEFENHKKALIALKLEKPKKLYDKSKFLWREISSRAYLFNREQLEADEIAKLSKDDVIEYFGRFIAHGAPELKQVVVNVESRTKPGETGTPVKTNHVVTDVEKFKATHGFFDEKEKQSSPTTFGDAL